MSRTVIAMKTRVSLTAEIVMAIDTSVVILVGMQYLVVPMCIPCTENGAKIDEAEIPSHKRQKKPTTYWFPWNTPRTRKMKSNELKGRDRAAKEPTILANIWQLLTGEATKHNAVMANPPLDILARK